MKYVEFFRLNIEFYVELFDQDNNAIKIDIFGVIKENNSTYETFNQLFGIF